MDETDSIANGGNGGVVREWLDDNYAADHPQEYRRGRDLPPRAQEPRFDPLYAGLGERKVGFDSPLTPTGEAAAKVEAWVQGPGDGEAKRVFAAQVADMVNSPAHYAYGAVEPIDYMRQVLGEEGFIAFCHGCALKYLSRALYKGAREQDYAKAAWYCRMAAGDDPRKERA